MKPLTEAAALLDDLQWPAYLMNRREAYERLGKEAREKAVALGGSVEAKEVTFLDEYQCLRSQWDAQNPPPKLF